MTYIIGDLHGCFYTLMSLLETISPSANDKIVFLGDYINKGKNNLEVLRFLKQSSYNCILGNHEISLLEKKLDHHILKNEIDKLEIIDWVYSLDFIHYEPSLNSLMVHAGILPEWDIDKILNINHDAKKALDNDVFVYNLKHMHIKDELTKNAWIITNIRFVSTQGQLSNNTNKPPQNDLIPWYELGKMSGNFCTYFGHWSRLKGELKTKQYCNLDGGAAYGQELLAYNIEKDIIFRQAVDKRDING